MPLIEDIYNNLSQARVFSVVDATSGYYQIALSKESQKKTAFKFNNKKFEFCTMPFGLCNAPSTFQRIMKEAFQNELGKLAFCYLDDIVIFLNTKEEHDKHLTIMFGKAILAGVVLNKKNINSFNQSCFY